MRWIRKNFSTVLLLVTLMIGISLLLYPTISDYWNSFHQSRAIAGYAEAVAQMDEIDYEKIWNDAVEYNKELQTRSNHWFLTEEQQEEYESMLNVSGNGIMGYIEIPSIKVSLPIYHGVDEGILQVAIGHIEGSSLPVGGKGSHCVISGHRGLPSAKLFTDLDQLAEGDIFMLRVLDETLTYEVDQILIVEPSDMSSLEFDEEKDYCTLVTCTPYGINSHRLLVRGHRVANLEESEEIRVTADAQQIDPVLITPALAGILLVLLLLGTFVWNRVRSRR
ncbi:MAG: class C sortase [Lachnospiraceae bacterium]